MSQKSSLPQAAKAVSHVLMSDRWGVHPCALRANLAANSANSSFRSFEALVPACRRGSRCFWFRTFSFSRFQ
jgi:hypothetical protein